MKFENVLKFNVVPEWTDEYINYAHLKKLIYNIEKQQILGNDNGNDDPSLEENQLDSESIMNIYNFSGPQRRLFVKFVEELDKEALKVDTFYKEKENIASNQLASVELEFDRYIERYDQVLDILEADSDFKNLNTPSTSNLIQNSEISSFHSKRASRSARNSLYLTGSDPEPDSSVLLPKKKKSTRRLRKSVSENLSISENQSEQESSDNDDNPSETVEEHEANLKYRLRQASSRKRILIFKTREIFITLSDIQLFAKLNLTGFNKILKKFQKVTDQKIKSVFTEKVLDKTYCFNSEAKSYSEGLLNKVIDIFAGVSGISIMEAKDELKNLLRDQVVWDRNTVWRDMIKMERNVGAIGVVEGKLNSDSTSKPSSISFWSKELTQITYIIIGIFLFAICLVYNPFTDAVHQRCWALLIFVSFMWATEAIPLHVTAILVPFLVVVLRVMRDPLSDIVLPPPEAAKLIFSSMFGPVIMLLLGGFTLAAALSKHNIAKMAASYILSKVGESQESVLLANLFVATFASMWISNVAAPVLCFSIIQPILRTLPKGHPLAPCLVIGIALASNVGGMASPIASPQNIIAIGIMDPAPSWLQWFIVSIPTCIMCDFGIWFLLLFVYKPSKYPVKLNRTRFIPEKLNSSQWYVLIISALTILLWCLAPNISSIFGDMGVLAVFPIIFLFSISSILTKEDFNNFLWTVVILAMGGTALGKAVQSSGLLKQLSIMITSLIDGMPPYYIMCVFSALVLVVCTFVSHTVGALIILPIVFEVGNKLEGNYSGLLVMASTLMASGAMGLPVSGFPNMNAIMLEDATGSPYLTVSDFFAAGIPSSIVAYFVVITVGYFFMVLASF
ncbi:putative transporter [Smittium mucronatum]|uniref:Putative transporter n=1 Tax=Smittium mucronatum TaxID=133383 RepID=A0A1R0GP27_9FUNG|nr:putative transporter [Smittium mucronatum]